MSDNDTAVALNHARRTLFQAICAAIRNRHEKNRQGRTSMYQPDRSRTGGQMLRFTDLRSDSVPDWKILHRSQGESLRINDDPKSRDRNSTQLVWSTEGLTFSLPRSCQAFSSKTECGKKVPGKLPPELSSYTTFDNNSRPIAAKLIELTLQNQPDKHMIPIMFLREMRQFPLSAQNTRALTDFSGACIRAPIGQGNNGVSHWP